MALKLPSKSESFKVVMRIDSALGEGADYDLYLESLNEEHLRLVEEPTRLVMRKVLPYRLAQGVQNQQFSYKGGEVQIQPAFMLEEVRCSIISVENPATVAGEDKIDFKAHSDGGASEDLMSLLQAAGLVMDLYRARQTAVGSKDIGDGIKKK
jgi:hypothetical protein